MTAEEPLICPLCDRRHSPSERFCASCAVPLIHTASTQRRRPAGQLALRARKVKPQYAEGALVKVARANNQPEAEFIAGLLLNEGIPSMTRRSRGADVPDFLAAGPRDVLVPESGAQAAREALTQG